ncbi:MAG: tRNA (adenosine(37)-N6)-threonylcarbamoyltransferase complex ATPase subunit type 1 TsaE [Parcubacteria group bacterium RIFCSPLOWO2_01_FULL_40_65]|nr:MAG: tRNA (adenosine(37)-N6)-threonylcarbamoyltransferase complex ATPase subunit type 1 TsaE [Parcubacteria group bacterium RIFCSPHIGHO2_02_FULL_40_12]OHB21339.1 MAG: tRNA (adenosine(37)-N6)-threonylcarbamoyltransferase complex ATPase subunit type 1 TsaE [Parcubacteria group bacterium RIFCSPLOWO2_01_FULL_40_65]OHB23054.1 MAG: tRNA (adenosine(37)-N6)-threonylcarbamoyltransferase complex ATPase subunit type 1 TsaE [Parcubacteria group bacterium RIFCSPLOWO2_02_FULL_40_12]
MQSIITESPKETEKFAAQLAKKLINKKNNKALVLALEGELGGGKTTFIKGFLKALKVIEKVLSPTFVLIHKHHLKSGDLYHIDAYRLKSEKDLLKLGIKEIFNNPKNIVLIEWADRVKKIIPKTAIWIRFEHLEKNRRKITIEQ